MKGIIPTQGIKTFTIFMEYEKQCCKQSHHRIQEARSNDAITEKKKSQPKYWYLASTPLISPNIQSFFLIGTHSIQGGATTTRHRVTRKRSTKMLKHTENLFKKNPQLKDIF